MSRLTLIGLILVVLAGAGLFQLKHTVEDKYERIATLDARYEEDRKAIRVLRAEWAYLNSPDYLQKKASRYLLLRPVGADQILASLDMLPWREGEQEIIQTVDFVVPEPREKPRILRQVFIETGGPPGQAAAPQPAGGMDE